MHHNTAPYPAIEASRSLLQGGQVTGTAPRTMLPRHEEALARLEYVAARQRGFALLTGPAGSGKTAVLREFADGLRRGAGLCVYVDACGCGETELLRECCDELGLGCPGGWSAGSLRSALLEAVRGRCALGTPLVLVLDHAGRAGEAATRLIERLLHAAPDLSGPTLVAACREPAPPALAALARDYADVRIQLPPLTAEHTGDVIDSLRGADERYAALTPEAIFILHSVTGGELRQVNRLWRLLQTAADVDQADAIGAEMVDAIACELPD